MVYFCIVEVVVIVFFVELVFFFVNVDVGVFEWDEVEYVNVEVVEVYC